ncbi:hypothetical protein QBC43DRAFT_317290 [Cladorrhinum sp. PSN259]|nr:hypothetical protein QBC43DRAFT_317290 [Cladorrhinum sp. PSN259]
MDFDGDAFGREYAALSYCWGERSELDRKPPLRPTSATLSELKSGIPISKLPLTL